MNALLYLSWVWNQALLNKVVAGDTTCLEDAWQGDTLDVQGVPSTCGEMCTAWRTRCGTSTPDTSGKRIERSPMIPSGRRSKRGPESWSGTVTNGLKVRSWETTVRSHTVQPPRVAPRAALRMGMLWFTKHCSAQCQCSACSSSPKLCRTWKTLKWLANRTCHPSGESPCSAHVHGLANRHHRGIANHSLGKWRTTRGITKNPNHPITATTANLRQ